MDIRHTLHHNPLPPPKVSTTLKHHVEEGQLVQFVVRFFCCASAGVAIQVHFLLQKLARVLSQHPSLWRKTILCHTFSEEMYPYKFLRKRAPVPSILCWRIYLPLQFTTVRVYTAYNVRFVMLDLYAVTRSCGLLKLRERFWPRRYEEADDE